MGWPVHNFGRRAAPPRARSAGRKGLRARPLYGWTLGGVLPSLTAVLSTLALGAVPAAPSPMATRVGAPAGFPSAAVALPVSPLRSRIVAIAMSQVGYRSNPARTYCNKFSAYWGSGGRDCGNANTDEQCCAVLPPGSGSGPVCTSSTSTSTGT